MLTRDHDKEAVERFLGAIKPIEAGYKYLGFNYIAVKRGPVFAVVQGRMVLQGSREVDIAPAFCSENVRAGHVDLTAYQIGVLDFIQMLESGVVKIPRLDELHFPAKVNCAHSANLVTFHPDGLQRQVRINMLTIAGAADVALMQPELDWEVRAADRPYANLQEIAGDFHLTALTTSPYVEILALNVAGISNPDSRVSGTVAKVQVMLASSLAREKARLTYSVHSLGGGRARREFITGDAMKWIKGDPQIGVAEITVPEGSILDCSTVYDGMTQSHLWVLDPDKAQNPRRVAYERFDPRLTLLRGYLSGQGKGGREIEPAVGVLLWMLGFNGMHLGGVPKLSDAPDLIANTPGGHFAVIECTTGLLKEDSKLAHVHSRTEAVRKQLADVSHAYAHVMSVIVTSKPRREVDAEIEAAERLRIMVVTQETLEDLLRRSLMLPNPDEIYSNAEQAINAAWLKYQPKDGGEAN
jgi:hypothetical protein